MIPPLVRGRGRRRGPRPRFILVRLWAFIPLLVVLVTAFILLPRVLGRLGVPMWWMAVGGVAYGALLTWLILWFNWEGVRTRRRIRAGERPCWRCGYDLSPQGDAGTCPECGERFEAAALDVLWDRWLAARRRQRGS